MTNRFTIQPSEKEGFWIARDNEAGITLEFLENSYNENQTFALDDSERDIVENYPKYEIKFKSVEIFEWLKNALS